MNLKATLSQAASPIKTMVHHARTILIVLLVASLAAVLRSTRNLSTCSGSINLQEPALNDTFPSIAFVGVVSMQRSAATSLAGQVLAQASPCGVSLNAIFLNSISQSGNAWSLDGSELEGSTKELEPSLLRDFLVRVGKRKCADKLKDDVDNTCHNKCIVAFKEFDDHLTKTQHEYIWKHTPNMTVVVLEREVQDRWKSRYVSAKINDWDTKGSFWHKEKMDNMMDTIPLLKESEQYCDNMDKEWRQLCHFEEKHKAWYKFVREAVSPKAEVSFNDTVLESGKKARDKIAAALPEDYRELLQLDYHFTPEIALVAVASMRRSASTSFLKKILVHDNPCAVSLGDVFSSNTDKSEDAWLVEGKELDGSIDTIEPSLLSDFLVKVARRKCAARLMSDTDYKCRNKCLVGFKEFREHLSMKQHAPNMTVVVLERDVQARWKSRWVAASTGDWDTTGSTKHKQTMMEIEVPPMNISESKEVCNSKNYALAHLCHFESYHKTWYKFIREKVPLDKKVEISFEDTVANDGSDAHRTIASGLPVEFQYLASAKDRIR